MTENAEGRPGMRAQWAAASPGRRFATGLFLVATIAIIAYFIIPTLRAIFEAGQHAAK